MGRVMPGPNGKICVGPPLPVAAPPGTPFGAEADPETAAPLAAVGAVDAGAEDSTGVEARAGWGGVASAGSATTESGGGRIAACTCGATALVKGATDGGGAAAGGSGAGAGGPARSKYVTCTSESPDRTGITLCGGASLPVASSSACRLNDRPIPTANWCDVRFQNCDAITNTLKLRAIRAITYSRVQTRALEARRRYLQERNWKPAALYL